MFKIISLVCIIMFISCDNQPKTWSNLLRTSPEKMQIQQKKVKDALIILSSDKK